MTTYTNKTIIRFGFCVIQNSQLQGLILGSQDSSIDLSQIIKNVKSW